MSNNKYNALKKDIEELIGDYYYKVVDFRRDLNNMSDRDRYISDSLDKTINDLEEILKKNAINHIGIRELLF
jgi:hypothetical protein